MLPKHAMQGNSPNQERDRELEALSITAEITSGFEIKDHLDVRRIHEVVLSILEDLTAETARERVFTLLGLEAD